MKWSELSSRNRWLITIAGIVEVALLTAALNDIRKRPADQINGPKWLWSSVSFVNFVGPISYFAFGRRRQA